MTKKRTMEPTLYFMVIYILFLVFTPALTSPSFGHETFIKSVHQFFSSIPFDITTHLDDIYLHILVNVLFWTVVFNLILQLYVRLQILRKKLK